MGYGMTIPFDHIPLIEQRELIGRLVELGYTDVWTGEADGYDGLTPLVLASAWEPSLHVGTAILPAYTRSPALMAQSAASLAAAAPGRAWFGIGTSSDVIVERWNGVPFDEPYKRVRDVARFLRIALTGEKVKETYDSFTISGFRLKAVPAEQPKLLIAALRPGMLRLAGRESDGAIINWLSADDVATVVPHVHEGGEGKAVVARVFVAPTTDRETVMNMGRFAVAAYLNVPVYRAFHEWLGRGPQLQQMWDLWEAGDRQGALAAIPEGVIDELIVHGSPEECRAHIQRYIDNGVTTPTLAVLPFGLDVAQAIEDLAPQ